MNYLTFIKLVNVIGGPGIRDYEIGEYYQLIAQAINTDERRESYMQRCWDENFKETNPTIRYQLFSHETPKFNFKKAICLSY